MANLATKQRIKSIKHIWEKYSRKPSTDGVPPEVKREIITDVDVKQKLGNRNKALEENPRNYTKGPANELKKSVLVNTDIGSQKAQKGQVLLGHHSSPVVCIAVDEKGQKAFSCDRDGRLCIWNVETGQCLMTMELQGSLVTALAPYFNGGKAVLGREDGSLLILDVSTGSIDGMLGKHTGPVSAVTITSDERFLLSASVGDNSLCMWSMNSRKPLRIFQQKAPHTRLVALEGVKRRMLVAIWDWTHKVNTLELRDFVLGNKLTKFEGHGPDIYSVALASGASFALSVTVDGFLQHWDLECSRLLGKFEVQGAKVMSLALTQDGQLAILGMNDGSVIRCQLKR